MKGCVHKDVILKSARILHVQPVDLAALPAAHRTAVQRRIPQLHLQPTCTDLALNPRTVHDVRKGVTYRKEKQHLGTVIDGSARDATLQPCWCKCLHTQCSLTACPKRRNAPLQTKHLNVHNHPLNHDRHVNIRHCVSHLARAPALEEEGRVQISPVGEYRGVWDKIPRTRQKHTWGVGGEGGRERRWAN